MKGLSDGVHGTKAMNVSVVSGARKGLFSKAGLFYFSQALKEVGINNRKLVLFNLDGTMDRISNVHHELPTLNYCLLFIFINDVVFVIAKK